MRRIAFLLIVGGIVCALGLSGARAADDNRELELLRAENKLLKATVEQRDGQLAALRKEIAALKDEVKTLKAGPEQTEVERLRKELAAAKVEVKKLADEKARAEDAAKPRPADEAPKPCTFDDIAEAFKADAKKLDDLKGRRLYGDCKIWAIDPDKERPGTFIITVVETFVGDHRSNIVSRDYRRGKKQQTFQLLGKFHTDEEGALRLHEGMT